MWNWNEERARARVKGIRNILFSNANGTHLTRNSLFFLLLVCLRTCEMQLLLIVKQENPNREREREISISEEKKPLSLAISSRRNIYFMVSRIEMEGRINLLCQSRFSDDYTKKSIWNFNFYLFYWNFMFKFLVKMAKVMILKKFFL